MMTLNEVLGNACMLIRQEFGHIEQEFCDEIERHMNKEWQGLSDDEIGMLVHECNLLDDYPQEFVHAVEARLKEMNT